MKKIEESKEKYQKLLNILGKARESILYLTFKMI